MVGGWDMSRLGDWSSIVGSRLHGRWMYTGVVVVCCESRCVVVGCGCAWCGRCGHQAALMRVVDVAVAAMDAHRGVAGVVKQGLAFLRNQSAGSEDIKVSSARVVAWRG